MPHPALPEVRHVYRNHFLDSTRWDHYRPRDGDVIVATPYKSGTTWTLNIVRHLIFLGQEVPPFEYPWLDCNFGTPLYDVITKLEAQEHRRYIKSHLALDGLPYYPQVKYIVVGRDVRDVFMSFWNHYRTMTPEFIERLNSMPSRIGPPVQPCPDDIHELWRDWITRGWFDWESEGYPWFGNMHNAQSWWDYRHLPNILFLHYNDLKADLATQIRRIASYLDIAVPDEALPEMMAALSLDAMRKEAEAEDPEWAKAFFYKGTNGRWRDVLTSEEVAMYEQKAAEVLTPDCRRWLETAEYPDAVVRAV